MQYSYGGQTILEDLTKPPGSNIGRKYHQSEVERESSNSESELEPDSTLDAWDQGFSIAEDIPISMLIQELNFMLRTVTKLQLYKIPHTSHLFINVWPHGLFSIYHS